MPCLALVLATLACATVGGYKRMLERQVGQDISVVMQAWGPPVQTYPMPNGQTMYTWYTDRGAVAVPVAGGAYAYRRACKTTFTADAANRIVSWYFEGNACQAR